MFIKALKCSILIILLLRITRGSAISVAELTAQHSEDLIRQTKANEIRKYFNYSVDPCEDFYEFTCGNYAAHTLLEPLDQTLSPIPVLHKEAERQLKAMLEADDLADTHADKQVKNYYRSCVKLSEQENDYSVKLVELINEFGKMPLLEGDKWQENDFDWMTTSAAILYKLNIDTLFGFAIIGDLANNSLKRVILTPPNFFFDDRSYYVDEEFSQNRKGRKYRMVVNLMSVLGVEMNLAIETAEELLQFEIGLARGTTDRKLGLSLTETYPLVATSELQWKYMPQANLKRLIGDAMGFTPDEIRINLQYINSALQLLKNSSKRIVANYIFYLLMEKFVIVQTDSNFLEKKCMELTKSTFMEILENMSYRKFVTNRMEEGLFRMWRELKKAFGKVLQSSRLDWMQKDTRQYALEKLKAIRLKINSFDNIDFAQKYAKLNLNDSSYVDNTKSVLVIMAAEFRSKFYEPVNELDIDQVDSFSPTNMVVKNMITIPTAILKPYYLYSDAYPNVYNLASLGSIIGHELVHGFDNMGRSYDVHGNARDWWDSQSASEFVERTQCFVNQYKKYTVDGKPLPESQAQEENIADNGGVRLAYEALKAMPKSDRISFPGFNYTQQQMFFIHYSQLWCFTATPEYKAIQANSDSHAPENIRIIGSLSNYDEFAKAFNCPAGTGMNPLQKCEIY